MLSKETADSREYADCVWASKGEAVDVLHRVKKKVETPVFEAGSFQLVVVLGCRYGISYRLLYKIQTGIAVHKQAQVQDLLRIFFIETPADYSFTYQLMQQRHQELNSNEHEIWFLEHQPVITLGIRNKLQSLPLTPSSEVLVVQTDRGGLATAHMPKQLVCYLMLKLKNTEVPVRSLVNLLEQSVIHLLKTYGITATTKDKMPGVYVENRKIASLGLRFKQHRSYHGIALNVAPDLGLFSLIDPCGYKNLQMTSIKNELQASYTTALVIQDVAKKWCRSLTSVLESRLDFRVQKTHLSHIIQYARDIHSNKSKKTHS